MGIKSKMKLKPWLTLLKKESAFYWHSPLAYLSLALLLLALNWLYWSNFYLINQASMYYFFQNVPLVFVLFIPALTMSAFSEERRSKTLEVLQTLPLTVRQIVGAKFAAAFLILLGGLVLTLGLPLTLGLLARPEWGPVVAGYAGTLLLAASLISIGLYFSTLTSSPLVSFLLSTALIFFLFLSGSQFLLDRLPFLLRPFFQTISFVPHFQRFTRGIVDLIDLVYFFSLTLFFFLLSEEKLKIKQ